MPERLLIPEWLKFSISCSEEARQVRVEDDGEFGPVGLVSKSYDSFRDGFGEQAMVWASYAIDGAMTANLLIRHRLVPLTWRRERLRKSRAFCHALNPTPSAGLKDSRRKGTFLTEDGLRPQIRGSVVINRQ